MSNKAALSVTALISAIVAILAGLMNAPTPSTVAPIQPVAVTVTTGASASSVASPVSGPLVLVGDSSMSLWAPVFVAAHPTTINRSAEGALPCRFLVGGDLSLTDLPPRSTVLLSLVLSSWHRETGCGAVRRDVASFMTDTETLAEWLTQLGHTVIVATPPGALDSTSFDGQPWPVQPDQLLHDTAYARCDAASSAVSDISSRYESAPWSPPGVPDRYHLNDKGVNLYSNALTLCLTKLGAL